MSELHDYQLPPRNSENANKETMRIYRTELSNKDYLKLELESMQRGLKPYGLTKAVMTLYLRKQLIYLNELPADIQRLIKEHFKNFNGNL